MKTPDERRDSAARASEEPTVSTAPAAAPGSPADSSSPLPRHGWWAAIPRRLGRARTSTVVLAVLFVAVFALWLNVKPETREARPADPAEVSGSTEPTGTTEPTQTGPTEPTEEPATTTQQSEPTTRPTSPTPTGPSSPDGDPGPTTTAPETTDPPPTGGAGAETAPGS